MLDKLGIKIDKKSIVPIVYEKTGNKISNVYISKKFGSSETIDESSNGIQEIKQSTIVTRDVLYNIFKKQDSLPMDAETFNDAVTEISDTITKITKRLRIQKEIFKLKGRRGKNQEYEARTTLEKIENLSEIDGLFHYIQYAADQLKRLNTQVEKRYKQGKDAEWNLDILVMYRDVANSYKDVGNISGLMHRYVDLFGEDKVAKIDQLCNLLQSYQRNILNACDAIGTKLHLQALEPYIGNVRNEYAKKARNEYVKDNPKKASQTSKEYQKQISQYVEEYLTKHESEIQEATKKWLKLQTEVANYGFECNSFMANFSSVYESKDPIVQATVILFDKAMNEQERAMLSFKYKLNNAVKNFREKYGVGNFSNLKDVFDDFVEIEGDVPYLVNKLGGKYLEAEKAARKEIFTNPNYTYKQSQEEFKKWLDYHNPIEDVDAFEKEVNDLMDNVYQIVDKKTKTVIESNLKLPLSERQTWYSLMKQNLISEEVKDMLDDIESSIEPKYRKPNRELYPNEKYQKLMQLKETNDPKYQLYSVLLEAIDSIDYKMPKSLKLNYRLPGIIKRGAERVGADGLMSAISNAVQQDTIVMRDDDIRGTFVNEEGKRINQVPMFFHYDPKIKLDEQSFDLPTIFYKWYDQATTYVMKKEIEGHILQTQAILQTRETEDRTFSLLGGKKERTSSHKTGTQSQFEGWVDQVFYGNRVADMGSFKLPFSDKRIDIAKLIKSVIKYSTNRTMSANVVSAVNNFLVAEINQLEEAFAKQFVSVGSYAKATKILTANMQSLIGDINNVVPKNKINKLAEAFGIYNSSDNMMLTGLMRHSINDYGHALTKIGDKVAQLRFMIATLLDTPAKNSKGEVIGTMWDFVDVDDNGILTVDEKVDNFDVAKQDEYQLTLRRILMGLHGNYNTKRAAVKAEPQWYGMAGLSLRRWIEPNFERRFSEGSYSNLTKSDRKGFLRDGFSYVFWRNPYTAATINFFLRNKKDAEKYKIQAMRWDELDDNTRANIWRFTIEFGSAILSYLLFALLGGSDGDDDDATLSFVRYQAYRLYTDMTFFVLPTSFVKILNDPFPVIGVLTDITNLFTQLFNPFEEYRSGEHLFDNKLLNQSVRMIPGAKQVGRLGNIAKEMEVFMRQR